MTRSTKGKTVPGDCLVFYPTMGRGGGRFIELLNTDGGVGPISPRILAILFGALFLGAMVALSPGGFSDWKDWALLLPLGGGFVLSVVSVHCVRVFPGRIEYENMLGSRTQALRDLVTLERSRASFADGSELDLRRYSPSERIFCAIARNRPDLAEGVFSRQELSMDPEVDTPPETRAWSIAIGVGLGGIVLLMLALKAAM
ncbi:MAG: hypothetical protein IPN71_07510 [Fibrobacteres bacterium]|nr:hypothetical protein [Fibrobacterota bacterium]